MTTGQSTSQLTDQLAAAFGEAHSLLNGALNYKTFPRSRRVYAKEQLERMHRIVSDPYRVERCYFTVRFFDRSLRQLPTEQYQLVNRYRTWNGHSDLQALAALICAALYEAQVAHAHGGYSNMPKGVTQPLAEVERLLHDAALHAADAFPAPAA